MTTRLLKTALSCLAGGMLFAGAAFAQPVNNASQIDDGIEAYRAGDFANAWRMLQPIAAAGDAKAQRYLGYILVSGNPPAEANGDARAGVDLLTQAALAGDYASLIKLEQMRRAGEQHAPKLSDIIAIETARAEEGDPVTAWRLANRYETGEGVRPSFDETEKWLTVVASGDAEAFPKTHEAAFRLCEMNAIAGGEAAAAKAKAWCARAAEHGHAGAAIMLRRIAQLDR